MREITTGLARLIYEVTTALTVVLLGLYATHRSAHIPLTYLTPFSDWSAVKAVTSTPGITYTRANGTYRITNPSWNLLAAAAWCSTPSDSPQCACLYNYYHVTFPTHIAQYDAGNLTLPQLQDTVYQGALTSCLRERPTWRKDTCNTVCSVHLAIPVILICLFASLFLSRVSEYNSHALNLLAFYGPLALAVLTFILFLALDGTAGLLACLTILCGFLEISFLSPCSDSTSAYHSYQRFLLAFLATWAAVTHQARDLYLIPSYGALGFFLGTFAYYAGLVRPLSSPIHKGLSIYLWVGGGAILACLVLLVQQHWLPNSPATSSVVSVAALLVLAPLSLSPCPETARMAVALIVICACFLAAAVDVARV